MPSALCPCTSGRKLAACCGPYLEGAEPPDAEALMRSRFCAYALGRGEHLWRTLAATHPDRARPKAEVVLEYRRTSSSSRFLRLDVLDRALATAPARSRVLFVARVFRKGRDHSFVEASEFVHDGTGWRDESGLARGVGELGRDPMTLRLSDFPVAAG